jgi:hypothetical protein
MDPIDTISQLRPTADDSPTTKYTVMEPRGNIPRLHIRFWYGPFGYEYGYNFDLIDPKTKEAVLAPKGLAVQFYEHGAWHDLMATTEAMRLCLGVDPDSDDFRTPEKWQITPGTLVRFTDGWGGIVVGEVRVPNAPIREDPYYECFSQL